MCRTLLSWAAITNNLRVTAKGSVEQYSCFLLSEKGSSAIKEGSITFIFFFKKGEDNLVKQQLYIYSDPTKNTECRGTICNFWTEEFVRLARVCFTHRLDKWLNETFLIFFFFCSDVLLSSWGYFLLCPGIFPGRFSSLQRSRGQQHCGVTMSVADLPLSQG